MHFFVADGDIYTNAEFSRLIQEILQKKDVIHIQVPLWIAYCICWLSEFVGRLTGKAMTLNTDKYKILRQSNWICDVEPLRKIVGFIPSYNLRQGLEETIRSIY